MIQWLQEIMRSKCSRQLIVSTANSNHENWTKSLLWHRVKCIMLQHGTTVQHMYFGMSLHFTSKRCEWPMHYFPLLLSTFLITQAFIWHLESSLPCIKAKQTTTLHGLKHISLSQAVAYGQLMIMPFLLCPCGSCLAYLNLKQPCCSIWTI